MFRSATLINNYNKIFLFLFLPSFVTGVFLPNLLYSIFIFINLIFNFHKIKTFLIKYKILTLLFLFFYIFILISSLASSHIKHSLESSLLYFTFLIFIPSFVIMLEDNKKNLRLFYVIGILVFIIICLDAFVELIFGENILGNFAFQGRIAGLFGDRWVIGKYLIYLLPLLVGIFFLEFQNLNKRIIFISLISFFLSIIIIFFSGERASFLSAIIYLILILFFLINKISIKKILSYILVLFIIISIPFMFSDTNTRLKDNVYKYMTSRDFNENQYLAMFNSGYYIFKDNKLIGIGPNNFRKVCSEEKYYRSIYSCSTHPHNTPIQLLSEIGLIGTSFVYSVFLFFSFLIFRQIKSKKFSYDNLGIFSIQSAIFIYLWPIMITGNFFLSWYGYIYYMAISLYFFYSQKKIF